MKIIVFDLETCGLPGKPDTLTDKTNSPEGTMVSASNYQDHGRSGAHSPDWGDYRNVKSYTPRGEPVQMSAIVCDFNDLSIERFISFYCMPTEPISDGAYRVHGISNKEIKKLSGGKFIEDYLFEDYKDIFTSKGNIYMSYNIKFDRDVLINTLEGYSVPIDMGQEVSSLSNLDPNKNYNLCLMKSYSALKSLLGVNAPNKRWTKLIEALEQLNYTKLDTVYKNLTTQFGLAQDASFHSADYDTVAAWLLLYKMRLFL